MSQPNIRPGTSTPLLLTLWWWLDHLPTTSHGQPWHRYDGLCKARLNTNRDPTLVQINNVIGGDGVSTPGSFDMLVKDGSCPSNKAYCDVLTEHGWEKVSWIVCQNGAQIDWGDLYFIQVMTCTLCFISSALMHSWYIIIDVSVW